MSTSRIAAVLDALVALFDAALSIDVTDGPPLQNIERQGLYVGASADGDAIDFKQAWSPMGNLMRDESFEVPNLLYLTTGDTDAATVTDRRLAIFAHLASIENALRADPKLGISGYLVSAEFGTTGHFAQEQTPDGFACRIGFTITVDTQML